MDYWDYQLVRDTYLSSKEPETLGRAQFRRKPKSVMFLDPPPVTDPAELQRLCGVSRIQSMPRGDIRPIRGFSRRAGNTYRLPVYWRPNKAIEYARSRALREGITIGDASNEELDEFIHTVWAPWAKTRHWIVGVGVYRRMLEHPRFYRRVFKDRDGRVVGIFGHTQDTMSQAAVTCVKHIPKWWMADLVWGDGLLHLSKQKRPINCGDGVDQLKTRLGLQPSPLWRVDIR